VKTVGKILINDDWIRGFIEGDGRISRSSLALSYIFRKPALIASFHVADVGKVPF